MNCWAIFMSSASRTREKTCGCPIENVQTPGYGSAVPHWAAASRINADYVVNCSIRTAQISDSRICKTHKVGISLNPPKHPRMVRVPTFVLPANKGFRYNPSALKTMECFADDLAMARRNLAHGPGPLSFEEGMGK
jgi:hypothetical protein